LNPSVIWITGRQVHMPLCGLRWRKDRRPNPPDNYADHAHSDWPTAGSHTNTSFTGFSSLTRLDGTGVRCVSRSLTFSWLWHGSFWRRIDAEADIVVTYTYCSPAEGLLPALREERRDMRESGQNQTMTASGYRAAIAEVGW